MSVRTAPRLATLSPLSWPGHWLPCLRPALRPCLSASHTDHMEDRQDHRSCLSQVSFWKGTLWSTRGAGPAA